MKFNKGFVIGVIACAVFAFSTPSVFAGMMDLPEGDYKYSCVGCIRNLDMLNCNCPNDDGQLRPTNLHLAGCNRDISNKNGQLVCG